METLKSILMGAPAKPCIAVPKGGASEYQGQVVIIGAGVAGLSAALSLERMGVKNYTVLEASDRYGGRLKATPDAFTEEVGVPLDTGAEWIHDKDGRKVVKGITDFHDINGGGGEDDDKDDDLGPYEFIKYKPNLYFGSRKNYPMSWLYRETKWRRTSWFHWLEKHLYRPVQNRVELGRPVKEIIYGGHDVSSGVKLVLANGEVRVADKVICTAPLAVLKREPAEGGIHFEPPLPKTMREAIDGIEMPPGFRILFRMKEKFYPDVTVDNSLRRLIFTSEDLTIVYDAMLGKDHLPEGGAGGAGGVLAFVAIGGSDAGCGTLADLGDDELAAACLRKIDELFDGQGTKNLVGTPVVQNWTKEPFIRGAYSYTGPSRHRAELGRSVGDGRVIFAGEHTSKSEYSLVPGAAKEGRRAAVEAVTEALACK